MEWQLWCIGSVLGVLGLLMGSFVGAQVWRLRLRQLRQDQAAGYDDDEKERRHLEKMLHAGKSGVDRSHCLQCAHVLQWYDLLPLVSWLSTRGKCRYCKRPIGTLEPVLELAMAAVFVVSFVFWPYGLASPVQVAVFGLWLISLVLGGILFIYDAKWFLLPNGINYSYVAVGAVFAGLRLWQQPTNDALWSLVGSLLVLAGVYGALYAVSRLKNGVDKTWVGFGDVKLAVGLALFCSSWPVAFLAVFLANLAGTLTVLPGLIRGTVSRRSHIPFGPLLLVGTFIAVVFGHLIIDWYMTLLFL